VKRLFSQVFCCAVLGLSVVGCAATQSTQTSLADLARQRPTKKAAIVVNDDNFVRTEPTPAQNGPSDSTLTEPKPKSQPQMASAINVRAGNRTDLQQARQLLDSLRKDQERLILRYQQLEAKLAIERDDFLRRLYQNTLQNRDQVLARKQQEIDSLMRAIESAQRGTRAGHE
jgi:hypothetical protein